MTDGLVVVLHGYADMPSVFSAILPFSHKYGVELYMLC